MRETHREREREGEGEGEGERDRERQRETERDRERETERESIQQEIIFFVKAFDNVFLNYISTLKYYYIYIYNTIIYI